MYLIKQRIRAHLYVNYALYKYLLIITQRKMLINGQNNVYYLRFRNLYMYHLIFFVPGKRFSHINIYIVGPLHPSDGLNYIILILLIE